MAHLAHNYLGFVES